jgi:hypothetical protein
MYMQRLEVRTQRSRDEADEERKGEKIQSDTLRISGTGLEIFHGFSAEIMSVRLEAV